MTKYLASAALAAVISFGAFAAPAAAQVGVSIDLGGPGHYRGDHYRGDHRVEHRRVDRRVYSGRRAYVEPRRECREKTIIKRENGRKIVRTVRTCD